MTPGKIASVTVLLLGLSGGVALAQIESSDQDFYADKELPDPPLKPEHAFAASVATQDVAAVSPAATDVKPVEAKREQTARKSATGPCSALNPCAAIAPAARN